VWHTAQGGGRFPASCYTSAVRRSLALALSLGCGTVEPTDPYGPPNTSPTGVPSDGSTSSDTGSSTSGSDATAADTTSGCAVGTEGCPCTQGGSCDPALACLSNVCVDPGPLCPAGSQNCPCTRAMTCEAGLVCDANHCVPAG